MGERRDTDSFEEPREGAARAGASARVHPARPEQVEIPAGPFVMGSTAGDLERAVHLCEREPFARIASVSARCVGASSLWSVWVQQSPSLRAGRAEPSPCDPRSFGDEIGAHRVRLRAYAIDRTEVTVTRYAQCVRDGSCEALPPLPGTIERERAAHPAVGLTWDDARAFCAWAGGRLPTEAEWERAARGRDGRPFPWGWYADPQRANAGAVDPTHLAPGAAGTGCTSAADGFELTAPVGSYPAGASPDGLLDAAGNAWEWVSDFWDVNASPYLHPNADGTARYLTPRDPEQTDPQGPARGAEHVMRGGGYAHAAYALRTTHRGHQPGGVRTFSVGVRCAYDR